LRVGGDLGTAGIAKLKTHIQTKVRFGHSGVRGTHGIWNFQFGTGLGQASRGRHIGLPDG